jgi:hypothetical protein
MAKGGVRAGGGRPKKGARGRKAPQPAALPLPAHLSDAEQRIWAQMAPLATAMQTLTAETVPAFTLLCQVTVEVDTLRGILRAANFQHSSGLAHPLSTGYRQLVLRQEQLFARFGLAPQGRPVVVPDAEKPDEVSKWAGLLDEGDEDFFGDRLN